MSNTRRDKRKRRRKSKSSPARLEITPGGLTSTRGRLGRPVALRRRPVVRLGDDSEIGYCVDPQRPDDCFRAAIATATQIPIEQIPDPHLDERLRAGDDPEEISRESWERIAKWLDGRGLQLVYHETVPAPRERWIGVVLGVRKPDPADVAEVKEKLGAQGLAVLQELRDPGGHGRAEAENPFADHCLILSYDRIIFDPAVSLVAPRGTELRTWQPEHVAYGISFDPKPKKE